MPQYGARLLADCAQWLHNPPSRNQLLDCLHDSDWADAIDMPDAQVAVAGYCPHWWPAATRLLIRRVRLAPAQVSADPRSRRRRTTLHPDQRALPITEIADLDAIYGYSFIVTNLDVSTDSVS